MGSKGQSEWNLRSRIANLLKKGPGSDVEFLVGMPSRCYMCHKIILAAGSKVFERMFYGAFEQKNPIRVPDVTPKGFALMLQYLYSDEVTLEDEWDAFETAYSAKKYMIESLFDICENFLLNNLTLNPENVLLVHEESSYLGMKNLQNHCLRYVSRHARKVFLSRSHVKASRNTFEDILSLDLMNIESEREIVEALWIWGEERCMEEGATCSVDNVRRYTRALLKHVRFFAMTMEELAHTLESCQILDTTDELTLLWNFAMPRSKRQLSMPSDICMESKTRSISNSSKVQFPCQYRYDGNLTTFLIENHQMKIDIAITGSPVTVIGGVIAFKPIPCYSCNDRSLEIDVLVTNASTGIHSGAKCCFKATEESATPSIENSKEIQKFLLLDEYIVIGKEQVGSMTITVNGEGIRLMQLTEKTLSCDLGKSKLRLKFEQSGKDTKPLIAMKELMIV